MKELLCSNHFLVLLNKMIEIDPSDEWLEDPNICDAEKLAYFDSLPDAWLEDESIEDAKKLEHFYSLYPVPTPAPAGDALKYFIRLKLVERNIELDGAKQSWLNDDSVPDEEKRQWIVGILNANA